jgi:hypothetical protein
LQECAERAREIFGSYPVEVSNRHVTAANADELIAQIAETEELDLLSMDTDTTDYWIWQAIRTVKPRLVLIEYNATWPLFIRKTTIFFGASPGALEALGRKKGVLFGWLLAGRRRCFLCP